MDIWIYSDESGVFDKSHEQYFIFGGVIILSDSERQSIIRKYITAERVIRQRHGENLSFEVKASHITNTEKSKLFRSLNQCHKFGTIIDLKHVHPAVFSDKKHKQRYLDYAYKIALKNAFQKMISNKLIIPSNIRMMYIFPDEHSTATSGRYELHESLENEFKIGTFNTDYSIFFSPLFPKLAGLQVQYCNSMNKPLVRAADIISNRIYHNAYDNNYAALDSVKNLEYIIQP